MSALPITLFFSLLLALLFVTLFAFEQHRRRYSCAERDSLLPLADETPRALTTPARAAALPSARAADDAHDHAHTDDHDHHNHHDDGEAHEGHHHAADGGPCGCRTGLRPPCVGCLKRLRADGPTGLT